MTSIDPGTGPMAEFVYYNGDPMAPLAHVPVSPYLDSISAITMDIIKYCVPALIAHAPITITLNLPPIVALTRPKTALSKRV